MKALILIGGLGTRLRPLTCTTPKPLLPLLNKPFLEYQLDLLKRHGVREVVLCISYLSHVFERHFGDGRRFGVRITYVHERIPLGTGGAIRNAARHLDGTTLILNGDILTDVDLTAFIRFHQRKRAVVSIALARVKDPTAYGLVETDRSGSIRRFLEKPSWDEVTCSTINAGIYLFEPAAVARIPAGQVHSVERGLFPDLLASGATLGGFVRPHYWLDIGTVEKYLQAHADVMAERVRVSVRARRRSQRVHAAPGARIASPLGGEGLLFCGKRTVVAPDVTVVGKVALGDGVTIGRGAVLRDSVVLEGTAIGAGARLDRALVGKHCVIGEGTLLGPGAAVGDRSSIAGFSRLGENA